MREAIPKSPVRHSRTFEDVAAASELGIPITEFWSWGDSDQAYHLAFLRTKGTLSAYEHLMAEKEARRKRK
jgi:hypothetical protein